MYTAGAILCWVERSGGKQIKPEGRRFSVCQVVFLIFTPKFS